MSCEDLKAALANRTYPDPERFKDRPTDMAKRYQHASDNIGTTTPNTWDDITMARLRGDLTPDQYSKISAAWSAAHPDSMKGT
jgi:hypothetical protein